MPVTDRGVAVLCRHGPGQPGDNGLPDSERIGVGEPGLGDGRSDDAGLPERQTSVGLVSRGVLADEGPLRILATGERGRGTEEGKPSGVTEDLESEVTAPA